MSDKDQQVDVVRVARRKGGGRRLLCMIALLCRCRRRPTGKAMAELAVSVGQQLMHVDKPSSPPPAAAAADSQSGCSGGRLHRLAAGDRGCLLDLHVSDLQLPADCAAAAAALPDPPGVVDGPTRGGGPHALHQCPNGAWGGGPRDVCGERCR